MRQPVRLAWQLAATLAQAGLSWFFLLYLIPLAIVRWQQRDELSSFGIEPERLLGMFVFGCAAAANLWSRLTLAWLGRGSTIGITAPSQLVVRGPYAWLRNPVTTTTIAQGVGVFLYTGSALLIPYLCLLALAWHILIRPAEEHELQRRFGREYEFYRRSVRCWLPMRRRFRQRGTIPPIDTTEIRLPPKRRRHRHR